MRPKGCRREGELVAVAFNHKEQRVLEKSLATLRLEASYSMKLLDLKNRTVRVYLQQLRDKVSKLKSHLSPQEINELRTLEAEGKLQQMYPPVNLGSALQIAANDRRLNSSHGSRRRSSSHLRPSSSQPPPLRAGTPRQTSLSPGPLKRSNSVTGVFIDAPPPVVETRPASASLVTGGVSSGPGTSARPAHGLPRALPEVDNKDNIKSLKLPARMNDNLPSDSTAQSKPQENDKAEVSSTAQDAEMETSQDKQTKHRQDKSNISECKPQNIDTGMGDDSQTSQSSRNETTTPSEQRQTCVTDSQSNHIATIPASPTSLKQNGSHNHHNVSFSAHTATQKSGELEDDGSRTGRRHAVSVSAPPSALGLPVRAASTPRARYSSAGISSTFIGLMQDSGMDELEEKLYQERRAELLEEEQHRSVVLTRRKDQFLKEVDQYLRDHPSASIKPWRTCSKVTRRKSTVGGGEDTQAADDGLSTQQVQGMRRRKVEFDIIPTHLPDDEYRTRLMDLWKDMDKCRYLRLADEKLDLSEVHTLAADTMKMYKVLKHQQRRPSQGNACSRSRSASVVRIQ